MGLFASADEKAAKQEEKLNALMEKYGLENLSPEYRDQVKKINNELLGSGLMEAGMRLILTTKPEDQLQITFLRTLVEQNWMIIRLLDEIKSK